MVLPAARDVHAVGRRRKGPPSFPRTFLRTGSRPSFLGHSFEQAADPHPCTEEREGAKLRSTVVYGAGEGMRGARERGHPHLIWRPPTPAYRHGNGRGCPAWREEGREGLSRWALLVPPPPHRGPLHLRCRCAGRPPGLWLPRQGPPAGVRRPCTATPSRRRARRGHSPHAAAAREEGEGGDADERESYGWSGYIFGARRVYDDDGSLLIEIRPPTVKTGDVATPVALRGPRLS
jgi:hypothetical protein